MSAPPRFLGIDFGTSKSTMAWFNPRTGQGEIIKNAEGEDKTPSVVYFGADGVLVGTPAENMLEEEEELGRVVVSVKRSIARPMRIALTDGRQITPLEVAAEILSKLKRDAETGHFKEPVERVVLTCPAAFSEIERDVLYDAALRSGFPTVDLLEEPVAAALAYVEAGLKVEGHVLVYDLGGGTFDLAVLAREDDGFRPALAPKGLRSCGGDDFDRALYDHCDELARQTLQRSVSGGDRIDLQFLRLCRLRKENLTDRERCEFSTYLPGGVRFKHALERSTFEGLIARHVEETVRLTRSVVEEAAGSGHPVATVVLIGGSSRVPLVRRLLLKDAGLPTEPQRWQQQDVAVALGAAYHGHALWGNNGGKTFDASLSSAGQLFSLHRQLKSEMAQINATGNLTIPARTIAKILALAPQDEVALQASLTLARPLLDQATEATRRIANPTWGALWQTEEYLSIAKVEAKLGDTRGAATSLEAAARACHALANRPDDQLRLFEEIAALNDQIGAKDAAQIALEAARACLDAKIAAYDANRSSFGGEISTLLWFAEAMTRLGDKGGAKGWFVAAKAVVPTIERSEYQTVQERRESALCSISTSQSKAGDICGAIATLKAVKDPDFTLVDIAKTRVDTGDIQGAVSAANAIADDYWQAKTFGEVALFQAKHGDVAEAISTLQQVRDVGNLALFTSDLAEVESKTVIETILNHLIETTSSKADGKDNNSFLISLFLDLASVRIRFKDLTGAKASLDRAISLIGLEKKRPPHRWIASLYAQLGEPVVSKSWFQAARKSADAIAKESDKWTEYRYLAENRLVAGDISGAKVIADAIADSSDKSQKWNAYEEIAVKQTETGDVSAAKVTADAIPDTSKGSLRWAAYRAIAAAQASAGDITGARVTAGSIPEEAKQYSSDPSRRSTALVAIAAVQIRARDFAGAAATIDEIGPSPFAADACRGLAAARICTGDRTSIESWKHWHKLGSSEAFRASMYVRAVDCLLSFDGESDFEFMPRC